MVKVKNSLKIVLVVRSLVAGCSSFVGRVGSFAAVGCMVVVVGFEVVGLMVGIVVVVVSCMVVVVDFELMVGIVVVVVSCMVVVVGFELMVGIVVVVVGFLRFTLSC